jgi:uncharacterized Zn finger protein (UPF0148 family)
MSTQDRDAAMKRTSELLLGGWKMLSMSCPICHTALMEKNNSRCCPSCNLPVYFEHEKLSYPPPPAASLATETTQLPQSLQQTPSSPKQSSKFESLEEAKKEYDKLQGRQQRVSTKIGEKLLCGWTLLSQECEDCGSPLMSLKGNKFCVCCDKEIGTTTSTTTTKQVTSSVSTVVTPTRVATTEEKKKEIMSASAHLLDNIPLLSEDEEEDEEALLLSKGENSFDALEEASQLISEKMVLGWALLQDVCEGACEGNVPLMRDPKKGQV